MIRRRALLRLAAAALATAAAGGGAAAQQSDPRGASGPVEITAENGIEWRRGARLYIARGNASATRGDSTVFADVLTAHYRDGPNGETDIYRVDAEGNVRIELPGRTAYGDRGTYDVDRGLLLLLGDDLRFEGAADYVTARDSLEYWDGRDIAVARGDAVAINGENELRGDVLTAYFRRAAGGERVLNTAAADGNVAVTAPDVFARGDSGVYYVKEQLATLTGDVKITRGGNQLNGAYAEVNLDSGVSRMFGAAPEQPGDSRVRGLLVPGSGSEGGGGS